MPRIDGKLIVAAALVTSVDVKLVVAMVLAASTWESWEAEQDSCHHKTAKYLQARHTQGYKVTGVRQFAGY